MKTPSRALSWELWQKNRWGLVALVLLLGICGLLRWHAEGLEREARRLAASDPNRGMYPAEQFLPSGQAERSPEKLRLKQGKQELCETTLQPGQLLEIEANFNGGPTLYVGLRTEGVSPMTLYNGPLRARGKLNWSTTGSRAGVLPLAFDPGFKETIALAALDAEHGREEAIGWSVGLLAFALLVLLGIFGLAEPTRVRGFTGLPPRRFTLPVSTGALVLHPVLIGTATVVILYSCWAWIMNPLVLASGRTLGHGYLILLLTAELVWFQALVWGLPSFPKLRACFLTMLVLLGLILASFPAAARNSAEAAQFESLERVLAPILASAWGLGVIGAWMGVRLERAGFWASRVGGWRWFQKARALRGDRLPPFASPTAAQFWIEWRRNGRLAVVIWVPLVWLCAGSVVWNRLELGGAGWLADAVGVVFFAGALAWVALAGLNLARDPVSKQLALSSFTAVRPITSGEMVRAKLMVAFSIWALGALVVAVTWYLAGRAVETPDYDFALPLTAVAGLLLSLHLLIGVLPLLLSGRLPGFPWSVLPLLLVYGGAAQGLIWFSRYPERLQALFVVLVLAVALKLAISYGAFRESLLRHIASSRWILAYAAVWACSAGLVGWWTMSMNFGGTDDGFVWFAGLIFVLPLARVALAPMAIEANRHR